MRSRPLFLSLGLVSTLIAACAPSSFTYADAAADADAGETPAIVDSTAGPDADADADADAAPDGCSSATDAAATCPPGMVRIIGGCFTKPDGGANVIVNSYCLDLTEVTAKEYAACVSGAGCTTVGVDCVGTGQPTYGVAGRDTHPMNCVDLAQATTYCASLGKRLPTGAEWLWAARGGASGTPYPWGVEAPTGRACFGRTYAQATCAIRSFDAGNTPQGVSDLAGNVWEWTTGEPGAQQLIRGGAWDEVDPKILRAEHLNGQLPTFRFHTLGFRCAK